MSAERLRVVVAGLAASYPLGGVFWDYIQYPLGLLRLGHDVLYLEDTGQWSYQPAAGTFTADGTANAEALARSIATSAPELRDRWRYSDGLGQTFGKSAAEALAFCASADVFLNVSGAAWIRDEYRQGARFVYIDSDPLYTQASFPAYLAGTADAAARGRVEGILAHDAFFSFGENIGGEDCLVPVGPVRWHPTRQPIVVDRFAGARVPVGARRRVLTTIASWERGGDAPTIDGVTYGGKSVEFEKFVDLPRRLGLPVEVAMAGEAPVDRLAAHGWVMVNPNEVAAGPIDYRSYLAHSFAEWSIAKHAYVASRSGWFSCRSACYLALGVPVIVQDTGFGANLPVGEGLLAFSSLDEAVEATERVIAEPERHAAAAASIAQGCFDSGTVLRELLDVALA